MQRQDRHLLATTHVRVRKWQHAALTPMCIV